MAYEYDIFVSYRRTQTVGTWVKKHLVPRLTDRLNEISSREIALSCDYEIESGQRWPDELKHRLRHSRILFGVWSADYFRSKWCMTEWQSFRAREKRIASPGKRPPSLVFPIRYADGDNFHPDAKKTQCRFDLAGHNYPEDSFSLTPKYIEFDEIVKNMAAELVRKIETTPRWRTNFPIAEPVMAPLPSFPRPVL